MSLDQMHLERFIERSTDYAQHCFIDAAEPEILSVVFRVTWRHRFQAAPSGATKGCPQLYSHM